MKRTARAANYTLGLGEVPRIRVLILVNLYFFLSLSHVDVSNGFLAIEDRGDLLEGGAFSLHKDEVDPDSFNNIPTLQK